MQKKHYAMFKYLINSFHKGTLKKDIYNILNENTLNKDELAGLISSLCGVKITYSDNFVNDIEKAISNYNPKEKLVYKINDCSMNCADKNGKTNCQKSCPFDAILVNKKGTSTYIDPLKCTDCGFCVDACVDGNIVDRVQFMPLFNLLKTDKPVIATVAPAICGQFGENVTMNQLRSAFKKLGFLDMVEVAFFADMLTLKEAFEFNEHVKSKDDLMITSCCCPMWVGMLKRVYADLVKHVSPSVSPMIASGRIIKKLNPECKVVFIGPCIAKKAEAKEKDLLGDIDFVLTFEELKDIFEALNIVPSKLPEDFTSEYASKGGRLYARTGGVSIAISDAIKRLFPKKHELLVAIQGNGVKECKEILSKAQEGNLKANFIEGMGCVGGCVGGPKALIEKEKGKENVDKYAHNSEVPVAIDNDYMKDILKQLGIENTQDFYNKEKTQIFHRDF